MESLLLRRVQVQREGCPLQREEEEGPKKPDPANPEGRNYGGLLGAPPAAKQAVLKH